METIRHFISRLKWRLSRRHRRTVSLRRLTETDVMRKPPMRERSFEMGEAA